MRRHSGHAVRSQPNSTFCAARQQAMLLPSGTPATRPSVASEASSSVTQGLSTRSRGWINPA
eukprot:3611866-Lingulodinium_polyedra.AAC.1